MQRKLLESLIDREKKCVPFVVEAKRMSHCNSLKDFKIHDDFFARPSSTYNVAAQQGLDEGTVSSCSASALQERSKHVLQVP